MSSASSRHAAHSPSRPGLSNQSIRQSVNQTISQSDNQSTEQSFDEFINQSNLTSAFTVGATFINIIVISQDNTIIDNILMRRSDIIKENSQY